MDYFEDVYIKDITSTFIENLSIQVNNQVSKYGNKEKVISKTLKNDIKFFFNKLFKYATDMNLYDVNPMQYYKVQNNPLYIFVSNSHKIHTFYKDLSS